MLCRLLKAVARSTGPLTWAPVVPVELVAVLDDVAVDDGAVVVAVETEADDVAEAVAVAVLPTVAVALGVLALVGVADAALGLEATVARGVVTTADEVVAALVVAAVVALLELEPQALRRTAPTRARAAVRANADLIHTLLKSLPTRSRAAALDRAAWAGGAKVVPVRERAPCGSQSGSGLRLARMACLSWGDTGGGG